MQSRSMITDRGRLRKTIAKPLEFRKDLEVGGLYKDIIHQINTVTLFYPCIQLLLVEKNKNTLLMLL